MTEPKQFLIYQSEDGSTRIDVMQEAETLWLNQKLLTDLFGKAKGTISEHIKHIFEDGELTPEATVRLFRTVQVEGGRDVTREVEHYNLDMILALGFRVRSPVAVRFRQWANDKLKEYIVKGFVLDDARLKNPGKGRDYFDELTRRLQDIRTSERRFYQKLGPRIQCPASPLPICLSKRRQPVSVVSARSSVPLVAQRLIRVYVATAQDHL